MCLKVFSHVYSHPFQFMFPSYLYHIDYRYLPVYLFIHLGTSPPRFQVDLLNDIFKSEFAFNLPLDHRIGSRFFAVVRFARKNHPFVGNEPAKTWVRIQPPSFPASCCCCDIQLPLFNGSRSEDHWHRDIMVLMVLIVLIIVDIIQDSRTSSSSLGHWKVPFLY